MHTYLSRSIWLLSIFSLTLSLHAQEELATLKEELINLDETQNYLTIVNQEEEILCFKDIGGEDYAICIYLLGKSYLQEFIDLYKASVYLKEAESIFEDKENYQQKGKCLFYQAVISFYLKDYPKAITDYRATIKLQEVYAQEELGATYNALAGLYKALQNYSECQGAYFKALELKREYDPEGVSIIYNNLATVYREMGYADLAKQYLDSCFLSTDDLKILDDAYTNLGTLYETEGMQTGDSSYFHEALAAHKKALIIREELGVARDMLNSYLNLGANYMNLEKYEQAKSIYEEALKNSESLAGVDDLRSILYINLSDTYYALNEDNPALSYLKKHLSLYDSTRLKETMLARLMHFERLEQEKALAQKDRELAEQREALANTRLYWVSIALMLLIGLLILSVSYYQRQKKDREIIIAQGNETIRQQDIIIVQERKINQQEKVQMLKDHAQDLVGERMKIQEKTLRKIARDLHDHIGNRITALLWGLSENDESQNFIRGQLSEIYDQVEGISQFLKPRGLQNGLLPSLGELCSDVEKGGLKVNLHTYRIKWRRFAPEVELNVFRIVQESLTNIIKYADAQEVNIQLIHNTKEKECLNLSIEDDGKGFDMQTYTPGIGISNMEDRTNELRGTFNIDSTPGQGTIIFIEIPAEVKGIRKRA